MTSACPTPRAARLVFPKSARLLSRAEFLSVQGSRHRLVARTMAFLLIPNDLGHFRVGFTVSRRHGNAVARNRARRRLREAVRRSLPLLEPFSMDAVVLPREGLAEASFDVLLEDVARLVRHLRERSS